MFVFGGGKMSKVWGSHCPISLRCCHCVFHLSRLHHQLLRRFQRVDVFCGTFWGIPLGYLFAVIFSPQKMVRMWTSWHGWCHLRCPVAWCTWLLSLYNHFRVNCHLKCRQVETSCFCYCNLKVRGVQIRKLYGKDYHEDREAVKDCWTCCHPTTELKTDSGTKHQQKLEVDIGHIGQTHPPGAINVY